MDIGPFIYQIHRFLPDEMYNYDNDNSTSNETSNTNNGNHNPNPYEDEVDDRPEKSTSLIVSEVIGILFLVCLALICLYFAKGTLNEW